MFSRICFEDQQIRGEEIRSEFEFFLSLKVFLSCLGYLICLFNHWTFGFAYCSVPGGSLTLTKGDTLVTDNINNIGSDLQKVANGANAICGNFETVQNFFNIDTTKHNEYMFISADF